MGLPADAQPASGLQSPSENSKLADEMSLKGLPNDSDAVEVAIGKQLNAVFLSSKLREEGSQASLPKEFLCSEKQAPVLAYDDFSGLEIPVIDLSNVVSSGSSDAAEKDVVEKIATACKQWGFFQVVNHGVPVDAVRKAEEQAKKLFSESFETKIQAEKSAMSGYFNSTYKMVANASSLPWTEGFQLSGPPNMDEEIDVLKRIWPETEVETFRQSMKEYHSQVQELGLRILGWIAQGLGSTMADVMGTFCSAKTDAFMRINHYPPCPEPSKVLGLAPHSDSATLTILNQGDVSGLQLLKKGQWVSVRPIPNAFSINIGEMAQVMSNGIYKSVLHRAVVNPVRDRYSMATFILPPKDKLITPLASAIVTQGRKAYYDFTWADFVAKRAQAKTSPQVSSEKPPSGEALKKYTLWVDGKVPQEVPEQGERDEAAALKKFTLWVDGKIPQEVPAEEPEASDLKKFTLWVDGKIPQEIPDHEEAEASDLKKFTLWVDGKIPQEISDHEDSEESDLKKFTLWVDGKIPQEIPDHEESEESDLKKFTLWVDGKIPQEIPDHEDSEESDLKKFTLWVDGKIPQEIPEETEEST